MAIPEHQARSIFRLALLAGLVAVPSSLIPPIPTHSPALAPSAAGPEDRGSSQPTGLDAAPPEVRAFLDLVLEHMPEGDAGVTGYEFRHWGQEGRPTRAAMGIKAIPGVDPRALIARVMDVDGYEGRIAHVVDCQSHPDPAHAPPGAVQFYQRVGIPGVARVQQESVLVDAGTIKGYRVAYWYLLRPETDALDPRGGARSEFSVGAWLAAPGLVGYAVSCGPRRADVNAVQWLTLTAGADSVAEQVVEGTIDGMAGWSRRHEESTSVQSPPATRSTSIVRSPIRLTIATSEPLDQTPSSDSVPSFDDQAAPRPGAVGEIGRDGSTVKVPELVAGAAGVASR